MFDSCSIHLTITPIVALPGPLVAVQAIRDELRCFQVEFGEEAMHF